MDHRENQKEFRKYFEMSEKKTHQKLGDVSKAVSKLASPSPSSHPNLMHLYHYILGL